MRSFLVVAVVGGLLACSKSKGTEVEQPQPPQTKVVESDDPLPELDTKRLGLTVTRQKNKNSLKTVAFYQELPGKEIKIIVEMTASGEEAITIDLGLELDGNALLDGPTRWTASVPPGETQRQEARLRGANEGVVKLSLLTYDKKHVSSRATASLYVDTDRILHCNDAREKCGLEKQTSTEKGVFCCETGKDMTGQKCKAIPDTSQAINACKTYTMGCAYGFTTTGDSVTCSCEPDEDDSDDVRVCCASIQKQGRCHSELTDCKAWGDKNLKSCTDAGKTFTECNRLECKGKKCKCTH